MDKQWKKKQRTLVLKTRHFKKKQIKVIDNAFPEKMKHLIQMINIIFIITKQTLILQLMKMIS